MKKIDLEILDIRLSGSSSGAYALVLGEVKGKRKLPIVIGGAEAQSIAIELENMRPSRPLTHDLMKNTLTAFGMEATEVLIHKMMEGIFYAQLTVTDGIREEQIDARSSDAVAMAHDPAAERAKGAHRITIVVIMVVSIVVPGPPQGSLDKETEV